MEDCPIGQSAVLWVWKPNFGSFCCGWPFVCKVWYSSGPPGFVIVRRMIVKFAYRALTLNSTTRAVPLRMTKTDNLEFDNLSWVPEVLSLSVAWAWGLGARNPLPPRTKKQAQLWHVTYLVNHNGRPLHWSHTLGPKKQSCYFDVTL